MSAFSFDDEAFVKALDRLGGAGDALGLGPLRRLAEQSLVRPDPVVVRYLASMGGDIGDQEWLAETFPREGDDDPGHDDFRRADWWSLAMAPWLETAAEGPPDLALVLGDHVRRLGWDERSIRRLVSGDPLSTLAERSRAPSGLDQLRYYGGWLSMEALRTVLDELDATELNPPARELGDAWADVLRRAVTRHRSLRIVPW